MKHRPYVALLRGINVGGNNVIRMSDLKACFEGIPCTDVATYIQSGNVIFHSDAPDPVALTKKIERALSDRFAYTSRVMVLSRSQLARVVDGAPPGFGSKPDEYKYDVVFLKAPLTASEAIQGVTPREGVDTVYPGNGVVYLRRLTRKLTQSRLSKVASLPTYRNMTIRNWNTTTRLLALLKER